MKRLSAIFILFISTNLHAQFAEQAKVHIKNLSSERFQGRGYSQKGVDKAACYIDSCLASYGIKAMKGKKRLQEFSLPINVFDGAMTVRINQKELIPGKDFIVSPESKGVTGTLDFFKKDSVTWICTSGKSVAVRKESKLTWGQSDKVADYTVILLSREVPLPESFSADIQIDQRFEKSYKTGNVCALIPGKKNTKNTLVFSAHYDHLGNMGKSCYFPGANDNASGTSLLLELAKHYSQNPPDINIGFIFFSGEEDGLKGSEYFVQKPLIQLKSIKFLVNLDLLGTGEEGITVVNATEFKREFEILQKLNEDGKFLPQIKQRGKARNSDHYWFTEKGVPAFFIYTMGGIKAYHDVFDRSETLPLTKFDQVHELLRLFVNEISKSQ